MLTLPVIVLWFVNICLDTLGQICFKYAAIRPKENQGIAYWLDLFRVYWIWIGIVAYSIEFFSWLAFLALVPLSKAVLLSSINIISIMLVGRILFKEVLIPQRIIGIVLIAAGVILIGGNV